MINQIKEKILYNRDSLKLAKGIQLKVKLYTVVQCCKIFETISRQIFNRSRCKYSPSRSQIFAAFLSLRAAVLLTYATGVTGVHQGGEVVQVSAQGRQHGGHESLEVSKSINID